jgi:hypothetical protein
MARMTTARKLLLGLLGGGGTAITYLFRDEFTTDLTAGNVNGTAAEPGPGTRSVVDSGSYMTITSSQLYTTNHAGAFTDPRFYVNDGQARVCGKALFFQVKTDIASIGGWFSDTLGATGKSVLSLYQLNGTTAQSFPGGDTADATTVNTVYSVACILRGTGGYIVVKGGSQYPTWTLIWPHLLGTTTPLYPLFSGNGGGAIWRDNIGVTQLPAPFNTDDGIATQTMNPASVNDTITHEANAILHGVWAAVTGEVWELSVRRTDDDNRWIVRCTQADSTIKLIEMNAGGETERSSAAQTWTNGTSYRVVVRMVGNTIKTLVAVVSTSSPSSKNSYTSATFNNTATQAKTNKALSVFASYPRTLSGGAVTVLDAVNFL